MVRVDHFKIQGVSRLSTISPNPKMEKAKLIAKIAFSILVSLVLFWMNPTIFFISFVVGVAFSKAIQKAVDKITTFIKQYKWPTLAGCIIMATLVWPVFIASGVVIWSAYMGSYLSQCAQKEKLRN